MNSKLISRPLAHLSGDHCGLTVESWFVYFRLLIAVATGCLTIAPATVMLQVQQQPPGQSAKRYQTGPCENMLPTFSLLLKIVLSFLVPALLMYTPNTYTHTHAHTHSLPSVDQNEKVEEAVLHQTALSTQLQVQSVPKTMLRFSKLLQELTRTHRNLL